MVGFPPKAEFQTEKGPQPSCGASPNGPDAISPAAPSTLADLRRLVLLARQQRLSRWLWTNLAENCLQCLNTRRERVAVVVNLSGPMQQLVIEPRLFGARTQTFWQRPDPVSTICRAFEQASTPDKSLGSRHRRMDIPVHADDDVSSA